MLADANPSTSIEFYMPTEGFGTAEFYSFATYTPNITYSTSNLPLRGTALTRLYIRLQLNVADGKARVFFSNLENNAPALPNSNWITVSKNSWHRATIKLSRST